MGLGLAAAIKLQRAVLCHRRSGMRIPLTTAQCMLNSTALLPTRRIGEVPEADGALALPPPLHAPAARMQEAALRGIRCRMSQSCTQ